MLILDGALFTSGRSSFLDQHPRFPEPSAKVFVEIKLAGLMGTWIAQVDTGAAYSVLEESLFLREQTVSAENRVTLPAKRPAPAGSGLRERPAEKLPAEKTDSPRD